MEETPGKNREDEQRKKSLEIARKTSKEEIAEAIKKTEKSGSEYPAPYNLTYDQYLRSLGLDPENLDDDETWEKYKDHMKGFGIDIKD